jgi:hypothetical protein
VVLVVIIFSVPPLLVLFGLTSLVGGLVIAYGGIGYGLWFWIAWLVLLAEVFLLIASFPGLRKHTITGWNMSFYGALLSLVHGLASWVWNFSFGDLLFTLIGVVISLYILFQIRPYYTGEKSLAESTNSAAESAPTQTPAA